MGYFVSVVEARWRHPPTHPSIHSVDPVYGMYFVCMVCVCIRLSLFVRTIFDDTMGIASHTRRARASLSIRVKRVVSESSRARDAGDGDVDLDARGRARGTAEA